MIKRKIKRLLLELSGKNSHLNKSITCKHKWYGNYYGGFYVCPVILHEKSIVYSFGIGEDISFDKDIIEHHNCLVFGFDPTPKSINWLKNQQLPSHFKFYEFGISHKSGVVDFYLPKKSGHVSGSITVQSNVDVKEKASVMMQSIEDIVNKLGHTQIDVLKMDIEGAEYDVIDNIVNSGIPINQILIEFHDRFFENGKTRTQRAVEKLRNSGYEIFAVSDTYEEVSFIHNNVL